MPFGLQECGEMTADGVTILLDCHALEDLTIRHTVSVPLTLSYYKMTVLSQAFQFLVQKLK